MNNLFKTNILRFFLLVTIQILILRNIPIELGSFRVLIFLYPVFLFLLPTNMPKQLQIMLGFGLGIALDLFYLSPGVHAGAAVFTGFFRNFALRLFGVDVNQAKLISPTKVNIGVGKFARFSALLLFLHIFVYYVFEVFTFYYTQEILIKTIGSFAVSYPIVIAYIMIFNPKR